MKKKKTETQPFPEKRNIEISCTEEELHLIQKALELYSRVAILQFNYIPDYCTSLQTLIWRDESYKQRDKFQDKCDELKEIFGYSRNSNPGIFNTVDVSDDARVAAHLHQHIRHEMWKSKNNPIRHYTVDEYAADTCQIAGIPVPKFNIKIQNNGKLSE